MIKGLILNINFLKGNVKLYLVYLVEIILIIVSILWSISTLNSASSNFYEFENLNLQNSVSATFDEQGVLEGEIKNKVLEKMKKYVYDKDCFFRSSISLIIDGSLQEHTATVSKDFFENLNLVYTDKAQYTNLNVAEGEFGAILGSDLKAKYKQGDLIDAICINSPTLNEKGEYTDESTERPKMKIRVLGFIDKRDKMYNMVDRNKREIDYLDDFMYILTDKSKVDVINDNIVFYNLSEQESNKMELECGGSYYFTRIEEECKILLDEDKKTNGVLIMFCCMIIGVCLLLMSISFFKLNRFIFRQFSIFYLCGMNYRKSIWFVLYQNLIINFLPITLGILVSNFLAGVSDIQFDLDYKTILTIIVGIFIFTTLGVIMNIFKTKNEEIVSEIIK